MNNTAAIEKMVSMKLHGMVRAFRESYEVGMKNNIIPDEMETFLVDAEWDERYNRKLSKRISAARFRYSASIEEVSTAVGRNIDKNKLMRFTDTAWITNAENIIITGATGVDKSFIASAIGHLPVLTDSTAYT